MPTLRWWERVLGVGVFGALSVLHAAVLLGAVLVQPAPDHGHAVHPTPPAATTGVYTFELSDWASKLLRTVDSSPQAAASIPESFHVPHGHAARPATPAAARTHTSVTAVCAHAMQQRARSTPRLTVYAIADVVVTAAKFNEV